MRGCTSPFERSWRRREITPSATYSTSPSREAFGLSSRVSAVNTAVDPPFLSWLARENSRARRSASSGNIADRREMESIATRPAPNLRRNSGRSDFSFVTVALRSDGSSLYTASIFLSRNFWRSHPNFAALATMLSTSSSSVTKIALSPSSRPSTMNCRANVVFPVPKDPRTQSACPRGTPPSRISSIRVLRTPMGPPSRDPLQVVHDEPRARHDAHGEARDLLRRKVRQHGGELVEVHVPLALAAVE